MILYQEAAHLHSLKYKKICLEFNLNILSHLKDYILLYMNINNSFYEKKIFIFILKW